MKKDRVITESILETVLEEKFEEKLEPLKDKMKRDHNEVMERFDELIGIYKTISEEQVLISHKVSEHTDTLEEHEERITKIEKTIRSS